MTLMDAEQPDFARERRRKMRIVSVVLGVLLLAALVWLFRFWPEEHVADKFFSALQKQDYESAYGIYFADPGWKQHPQQYSKYPYNEFYQDWGPGGEWGLVKSFKIEASGYCPGASSGVIVQAVVNGRSERARVWVQKSDMTLSFPPC